VELYKVFTQGPFWNEDRVELFLDIKCAISYWKHLIKNIVNESELPDRDDDIYYAYKNEKSTYYPTRIHGDQLHKGVIYKDKRNLEGNIVKKAIIPSWERTSYEYQEYDIKCESVVIEKVRVRTN